MAGNNGRVQDVRDIQFVDVAFRYYRSSVA